MRRGTLILRAICILLLALLWSCHAKPPAAEEPSRKGGVFSDVIEAIGQVQQNLPKAGERDRDVPRDEWKLIEAARERLTIPGSQFQTPDEADSGEPQPDTSGEAQGDALDVILDQEWEQYRELSAALPEGAPDPALLTSAQDSLSDFYRDLPILMSVVPDTLRERVLHIVVLRFFNTILRAGVDPHFFMANQPR